MSHDTFTWLADVGSQQTNKPTVTVTKFGDGYESRTPVGLNYKPYTWNLKFERDSAEIAAINSFLNSHGATQAFNWTTPLGDTQVFVCREWSVTTNRGTQILQAKFEQVFEA